MGDEMCSYLVPMLLEATAVIKELHIRGNSLSITCIEHLANAFAAVGGMPALVLLDLSANGLVDSDLDPFWDVLRPPTSLPSLDELNFSNNSLTSVSIEKAIEAYDVSAIGALALDTTTPCEGVEIRALTNVSNCAFDETAAADICYTSANGTTYGCCHKSYATEENCAADNIVPRSCTLSMLVGTTQDLVMDTCRTYEFAFINGKLTQISVWLCLSLKYTRTDCIAPP